MLLITEYWADFDNQCSDNALENPQKPHLFIHLFTKKGLILQSIFWWLVPITLSQSQTTHVGQQWSFHGYAWRIHSTHPHWHLCIPSHTNLWREYFLFLGFTLKTVFASSRQILSIHLSNCSNRNKKSWTLIMLMFQSFSTLSGLSTSVFYLLYYMSDILDVHSLHWHHLMMKFASNGPLQSRKQHIGSRVTVFPTNIRGGLAVKVSDAP